MILSRIDARLLLCPGATKALHEKWGWMVYWVGGRQFTCEFVASPHVEKPLGCFYLLEDLSTFSSVRPRESSSTSLSK